MISYTVTDRSRFRVPVWKGPWGEGKWEYCQRCINHDRYWNVPTHRTNSEGPPSGILMSVSHRNVCWTTRDGHHVNVSWHMRNGSVSEVQSVYKVINMQWSQRFAENKLKNRIKPTLQEIALSLSYPEIFLKTNSKSLRQFIFAHLLLLRLLFSISSYHF